MAAPLTTTPLPHRQGRPSLRALTADDLAAAVALLLGSLPTWQRQSVLMASRAAGWDLVNLSSLLDGISDRSLEVLTVAAIDRLMSNLDAAGADERCTDAERATAALELARALGR